MIKETPRCIRGTRNCKDCDNCPVHKNVRKSSQKYSPNNRKAETGNSDEKNS